MEKCYCLPRASSSFNLPLKTVVHFTFFLTGKVIFSGDIPSSELSSLDFTLWLRIRSRLVFVCSAGVERTKKEELTYCSNTCLGFFSSSLVSSPNFQGTAHTRHQTQNYFSTNLYFARSQGRRLLLHQLGKLDFRLHANDTSKRKIA